MKFLIIVVILIISSVCHGQTDCDSLIYWVNDEKYQQYDAIGFHHQLHMFLGEKDFVFQRYDHHSDLFYTIFGTYEVDSCNNMSVNYDWPNTIEFCLKNKANECMKRIRANSFYYKGINWKMYNDSIFVEWKPDWYKSKTIKYKFEVKRK